MKETTENQETDTDYWDDTIEYVSKELSELSVALENHANNYRAVESILNRLKSVYDTLEVMLGVSQGIQKLYDTFPKKS